MHPLLRTLYCLTILVLLQANSGSYGEDIAVPLEPLTNVAQELNIGDLMPDVPLRIADGSELRLRDFRGKVMAITFFYGRCTAAAFCPLAGRKFDAVQTLLMRMNAEGGCRLLSISLDPERDTPEVLSTYAAGYRASPELWTFATGTPGDLKTLGDAVGLEYRRVGDRIDHNLRTVILDSGGHIRQIFRGDGWTPQELVASLNATARRYR